MGSRSLKSSPGSSPLTRGKLVPLMCRLHPPRLIPAHAGKTCDTPREQKWCRAHPRSRGENGGGVHVHVSVSGSSPLTRGKRNHRRDNRCDDRLIPAHAGKTSTYSHTRAHPRAHPRSRGENRRSWRARCPSRGSSPLTRGKLVDAVATSVENGLIPAHAGKTTACRSESRSIWAHPRSRGENGLLLRGVDKATGSSPLTRGKLSRTLANRP